MPKIFKIDRKELDYGKKHKWEKIFLKDMIKVLKESREDNEERAFSVFLDEVELPIRSTTVVGEESGVNVPRELESHDYLGSFHTRLEEEITPPSMKVLYLEEEQWYEEKGKVCIGYAGLAEPTILCYEIDWDGINNAYLLDDFKNNVLDLRDLELIKNKVKSLEDLNKPEVMVSLDRSAIFHYITDKEGEPKEDFTIEEFLEALDERIYDIEAELDITYENEFLDYIKEKVLWREEA